MVHLPRSGATFLGTVGALWEQPGSSESANRPYIAHARSARRIESCPLGLDTPRSQLVKRRVGIDVPRRCARCRGLRSVGSRAGCRRGGLTDRRLGTASLTGRLLGPISRDQATWTASLSLAGTVWGTRRRGVGRGRQRPGRGCRCSCALPNLLEPGDHRLGGSHPLGEHALAEAGFGAQVLGKPAERQVLFDPGASLGVWLGPLPHDVFPAGVVGIVVSSGGTTPPYSSVGPPARLTSLRPL